MATNDSTTQPTTEEWRDVPGYEGLYQVSNFGALKSLDREDSRGNKVAGRVMKTFIHHWGYYAVQLSKDGHFRNHKIHSLVALTFIGARPCGFDVNHKDGNKLNNTVANLEYCSRGDNIRHAVRTGLRHAAKGTCNAKAKLTDDQVREIRSLLAEGVQQNKIAPMFGVDHTQIWRIAHGLTWGHVS